ncbi:MAG: hypothetical protein V1839_02345 [archaeon]
MINGILRSLRFEQRGESSLMEGQQDIMPEKISAKPKYMTIALVQIRSKSAVRVTRSS